MDFLNVQPGAFRHAIALIVSSSVQDEVTRLAATMADFLGTELRAFFRRDEAINWLLGRASAPPGVSKVEVRRDTPVRIG